MGLFGKKKVDKFEQERQAWHESARVLNKTIEEAARLAKVYEENKKVEADLQDADNYPRVAFTEESLNSWMERHAGLAPDTSLRAVTLFKKSVLNPSKSILALRGPLAAATQAIRSGDLDKVAAMWLIRAFVASYSAENGGDFSVEDAKLAARYQAVLDYLDSDESKPLDAAYYIQARPESENVFAVIDDFLHSFYYGHGAVEYQKYPCYSGLSDVIPCDRYRTFPSHVSNSSDENRRENGEMLNMNFRKKSYRMKDIQFAFGRKGSPIRSTFSMMSGESVTRIYAMDDYETPRTRWGKDMDDIFSSDRYKPACFYKNIAAILAHSHGNGIISNAERIDRMAYCEHNMGEARVNAALCRWVSKNPDWKIVPKDCVGPYSDKCIRVSAYGGRSPQEIDHLLVGPYGVIQIETKNYVGHIVIDDKGWWKYPIDTHLKTKEEFERRHYKRQPLTCPVEQVASHDSTLERVLFGVQLCSAICISAAGSTFLTPTEERQRLCRYDTLICDNLESYLTWRVARMARQVQEPYDVDYIMRLVEETKVKNLVGNEKADFVRDPSTAFPKLARF